MNVNDYLPLLTLLTSLVPTALIFPLREERIRLRTWLNMGGAIFKLVLIGLMLWGVYHGLPYEFRVPLGPGLEFNLRADPLAMFFVTLSGGLWLLTTIYAIAYLEGSPRRSRFFGFFSLCVSATVGIAMAGNLFTFVIFYELLTLSTYPLVVHRQTPNSLSAGRVYLIYTVGGGALLLFAAAWLHVLVPAVKFDGGATLAAVAPQHYPWLQAIFLLLIIALGVKAALVPLHIWLPRAMVAPAPVSALLHAVAVVKAGAFGIVRVVYDVYGIEFTGALGLATPLAVVAAATIIYGSLRALVQDDLKRRLALSTVSQVSYIALGVAILGPSSTIGGTVHLVHQGVMKITLFFCAGNLAETLGVRKISRMHGVGRRMPLTMAAFTLAAMGMIGVPPMAGFVSKWYLGRGAIEAGQLWVLLVLAASSALNAAYFLPILSVAWFSPPRTDWKPRPAGSRLETAWGLLVPPLSTVAVALGCGLLAGAPFSPLQWATLISERSYGIAVLGPATLGATATLSWDALLILAAVGWPLALAFLVMAAGWRKWMLWPAATAALPAAWTAFFVAPGAVVDLPWLLLHSRLGPDVAGQTFLLFTSLLWLAAGVYACGYLAGDPHVRRFFACFLLTMTGNVGLILAQDMISFYLFFALMSFASYGLIVHQGDAEAVRAGRVYMVLVVVGETVLFVGILLASVIRHGLLFELGAENLVDAPLRDLVLALSLIGLGIKAGIVPLHVWLPLAHPAAPTPASAILSGAMIKAGLLGWLRFLPLGEASFAFWGNLCLGVGLFTAFYAALVGVTGRNPKAVLAYSSISQMGLLTLAIGGGLLVPAAWPTIVTALLLYALHHGLAKGCLFLGVGVAASAGETPWRRRMVQMGLVLPALAMAGAPWTMGAVGKNSLKYALEALPDAWTAALDVLFPLASVGTTLLMARFLYLVWPRGRSAGAGPSPSIFLSWLAVLLAVLGGAWLVPASAGAGPALELLAATFTWGSAWPVVLGAAIALAAAGISRLRKTSRFPSIPPGDMLVLWQRGGGSIFARLWLVVSRSRRIGWPDRLKPGALFQRPRSAELVLAAEEVLSRWPTVGVLLLIILAACFWLGWASRL